MLKGRESFLPFRRQSGTGGRDAIGNQVGSVRLLGDRAMSNLMLLGARETCCATRAVVLVYSKLVKVRTADIINFRILKTLGRILSVIRSSLLGIPFYINLGRAAKTEDPRPPHHPENATCTYLGDELVYPNSLPRLGDDPELRSPAK